MVRTASSSLLVCAFPLLFCSIGNAFQGQFVEDRVTVATRVAPKSSTELPPADLRVDTSLVLVPT